MAQLLGFASKNKEYHVVRTFRVPKRLSLGTGCLFPLTVLNMTHIRVNGNYKLTPEDRHWVAANNANNRLTYYGVSTLNFTTSCFFRVKRQLSTAGEP